MWIVNKEAKIMEEIYKISEHKTLIVIAHRLSRMGAQIDFYSYIRGDIKRS